MANPAFLASAILWFALSGNIGFAERPSLQAAGKPRLVSSHPAPKPTQDATSQSKAAVPAALQDQNAVVRRYCATCHSDARKTGGL